MPQFFNDYSDERNKNWCYLCGNSIGSKIMSKDHIPSKVLLIKPYPNNLAVALVCEDCNRSYSQDEEYFAAFISAVLTGSAIPENQILESGKRILLRNPSLKSKIVNSRRIDDDPFNKGTVFGFQKWNELIIL